MSAREITFEIDGQAEIIEAQLKRGKSGRFDFFSDEEEIDGGYDTAPAPLEYFVMAVLF